MNIQMQTYTEHGLTHLVGSDGALCSCEFHGTLPPTTTDMGDLSKIILCPDSRRILAATLQNLLKWSDKGNAAIRDTLATIEKMACKEIDPEYKVIDQ